MKCIDVIKVQRNEILERQSEKEEFERRLLPVLKNFEEVKEEKERKKFQKRELFGTFDPDLSGRNLALTDRNRCVTKTAPSGVDESFAITHPLDNEVCVLIFTRVDDMSTSGSACVDFRDSDGNIVVYLDTCGSFSSGFDIPPRFSALTTGDSIEVEFDKLEGKVLFKPSTSGEVFEIVRLIKLYIWSHN
ncbi:hypothetical protein GEMRC1_002055 [Eukaryota sp. GEM-RC1]